MSWKRYYGDIPRYEEGVYNIWATTAGGPFADAAHIVDFARVLPIRGESWIVCYAQGHIYSPEARTARIVLAADNAARLWLNGKQVYERLRHPFWYEMNDNWADSIPVELKRGWNPVLIKAGLGRHAASGFFGFTFRVADAAGKSIPGIIGGFAPYDVEARARAPRGLPRLPHRRAAGLHGGHPSRHAAAVSPAFPATASISKGGTARRSISPGASGGKKRARRGRRPR